MAKPEINLQVVDTWFHKAKIKYIQEVPTGFYECVVTLGLIDTELDPDDMRNEAIREALSLIQFAVEELDRDISALCRPKRLTPSQNKRYDDLLGRVERLKTHRNAFAKFIAVGELDPLIAQMYQDLYQRTVVFYSKPLCTISDLGDVEGITGAPTE
jgi:hypothetical protein